LQNGSVIIKNKSVGPFAVETIKLKASATRAGSFSLNPEVSFADDLGSKKVSKTESINLSVEPTRLAYEVLPGRILTGTLELDKLMLGGIPEEYAVVLTAPSTDERQLLIKRFLQAGAEKDETSLYMTCEATNAKELAQQGQPNLSLIVCNLQADLVMRDQPNVYKLKGIDNLTDIDISITKYLRMLATSGSSARRACIDLISDVLLQHHAVVTRKWLSSLLITLKSKGFTTLAVVDPTMHPYEEVNAILGLFDGEIRIAEAQSEKGIRKTLQVTKLINQRYVQNEVILTKENIERS
jgi:KaiC/GvpD/RAD55 family RecA-like ATPase